MCNKWMLYFNARCFHVLKNGLSPKNHIKMIFLENYFSLKSRDIISEVSEGRLNVSEILTIQCIEIIASKILEKKIFRKKKKKSKDYSDNR